MTDYATGDNMAKSQSSRVSAHTAQAEGQKKATVVLANEAPAVPTYYSNNTAVETSIWDVCLKFAETVETDRENNITKVRELARVRMSPQHARVVLGILTRHLEKYERDFGVIPTGRASVGKEEDTPTSQKPQ